MAFVANPTEALAQAVAPAAKVAPHGRLWALVNHAGVPGLDARLQQEDITRSSLFGESADAAARQVAPLLFTLEDLSTPRSQRLLLWLAENGAFTGSLLFLWSELPRQTLLARLVHRLDVRLPEGEEVLMRFFDARVFEALVQVLSPEQHTAWLSPASHWWYVDRLSQLQAHEGAPGVHEVDPLKQMLRLDTQQFAALLDATEPDQVAHLLRQRMSETFLRIEPQGRHAFVLRHMRRGRREWGIEAPNDLAIYCGLALLHGEDFAARPAWHQALVQVASGKLKLTQAVERIESEESR
jgi:hypothetical protein